MSVLKEKQKPEPKRPAARRSNVKPAMKRVS